MKKTIKVDINFLTRTLKSVTNNTVMKLTDIINSMMLVASVIPNLPYSSAVMHTHTQ